MKSTLELSCGHPGQQGKAPTSQSHWSRGSGQSVCHFIKKSPFMNRNYHLVWKPMFLTKKLSLGPERDLAGFSRGSECQPEWHLCKQLQACFKKCPRDEPQSPHAMWKDSAALQAVLCSDPTQTATRDRGSCTNCSRSIRQRDHFRQPSLSLSNWLMLLVPVFAQAPWSVLTCNSFQMSLIRNSAFLILEVINLDTQLSLANGKRLRV